MKNQLLPMTDKLLLRKRAIQGAEFLVAARSGSALGEPVKFIFCKSLKNSNLSPPYLFAAARLRSLKPHPQTKNNRFTGGPRHFIRCRRGSGLFSRCRVPRPLLTRTRFPESFGEPLVSHSAIPLQTTRTCNSDKGDRHASSRQPTQPCFTSGLGIHRGRSAGRALERDLSCLRPARRGAAGRDRRHGARPDQ